MGWIGLDCRYGNLAVRGDSYPLASKPDGCYIVDLYALGHGPVYEPVMLGTGGGEVGQRVGAV